jgi:hypothetical protein
LPVISEGLQHAPAHRIINIDSQIGAGFETVKDLISEKPEFHQSAHSKVQYIKFGSLPFCKFISSIETRMSPEII